MGKMNTQEYNQTDRASEDEMKENIEEGNEKRTCPCCSRDVMVAKYPSHLIHCLRKFEMNSAVPGPSKPTSKITCPLCDEDMSHLNLRKRQEHMDRCLQEDNNVESLDTMIDCPICLLRFSSQKARAGHIKACGKNAGMSSQQVLEALRLQQRQSGERLAAGLFIAPPPPRKDITKRKTSRKTTTEQLGSEEMQVAMAMSMSLQRSKEARETSNSREAELLRAIGCSSQQSSDATKRAKSKTAKNRETPLLLLRSEEDRAAIIGERVAKLLAEKPNDADYYPPFLVNWEKVHPHHSRLKTSGENRLWRLAALPENMTSDPGAFYVPELAKFVSPCKVKPGEKLRRLSQVPGYLTQNGSLSFVDVDANEGGEDRREVSDAATTQNVLLNMGGSDAAQPSQFVSQGFFYNQDNETPKNQRQQAGSQNGRVSRRRQNFQNKLLKKYLSLVGSSCRSDCQILLQSNTFIPCHAAILCVTCPRIYDEMCNEGIVRWDNISRSTAIAFLQFIYAGYIVEADFSPSQLLLLAERYDLDNTAMNILNEYASAVGRAEAMVDVATGGVLVPADSSVENHSAESFPGDVPCDEIDAFGDDDFINDIFSPPQHHNPHSGTSTSTTTFCAADGLSEEDTTEAATATMPETAERESRTRSPDLFSANFDDSDDELFANVNIDVVAAPTAATEEFVIKKGHLGETVISSPDLRTVAVQSANVVTSTPKEITTAQKTMWRDKNGLPSFPPQAPVEVVELDDSSVDAEKDDDVVVVVTDDEKKHTSETASSATIKKRKRVTFNTETSELKRKRLDFGYDDVAAKGGGDDSLSSDTSTGANVPSLDGNVWDNFHDDVCDDDLGQNQTTLKLEKTRLSICHTGNEKSKTPFSPGITLFDGHSKRRSDKSPPVMAVFLPCDFESTENNAVSLEILTTPNEKPKKKNKKDKKSVTPMPNYSKMATPQVNKALSKIGVRLMPKKAASKLLEYVYEQTHPLVLCSEDDDESKDTPHVKRKLKKTTKHNRSQEGKEADQSTTPAPESPKAKARKKDEVTSSEFKDFISDTQKWRNRILIYSPIDLRELMNDMNTAGLPIGSKKLKNYLDEQCITFHDTAWKRCTRLQSKKV